MGHQMSRWLRQLGVAVLAALAGHLCVLGLLLLARSLIGLPATQSAQEGAGRNEIVDLATAFAPVTLPMAILAALFLIWRYGHPVRRLGTFLAIGAFLGGLFPAFYVLVNLAILLLGGDVGPFDMVFRIIAFALLLFGLPCALGGMAAAAVTYLGIRRRTAPPGTGPPQIPQSGSSIS